MCSWVALAGVLLDAVIPARCAACGEPARAVCPGCARALDLLPQPSPVTAGALQLDAAFLYSSPLREILHVGKYRDGRSALRVAALMAAERYTALPPPNLVVPVPLGRARRRARGYNQAEVVAGVAAGVVGAVSRPWLRRTRETGSQVGRSPAERATNLAGAFLWVGPRRPAGRLWLMDDVITTGATLRAAGEAVPDGVSTDVRGVALARAGDHLRLATPSPARRRRGIMTS